MMEKSYQANGKHKQATTTIFVSDKVNFKPISIRRAKKGLYIIKRDS